MNGHEKRKQGIIERIKRAALDLFSARGVDGVSMDEIASWAGVSKVTIYKYFHSKEQLRRAIVDVFVDEIMTSTERLYDSDLDFMGKLRLTMQAQVNAPRVAETNELFVLLEEDMRAGVGKAGSLNARIEAVKRRFYEQGKKEGFIDESLPVEIANLYSDIFQAGYRAIAADHGKALSDAETFERLLNLYFFGLIRRQ